MSLQRLPLLAQIVSASVNVAGRAGGIIRDVMRSGDLKMVDKGIDNPQTEADRRAQYCIIESLHRTWPALTIVGEEGSSIVGLEEDVVGNGAEQIPSIFPDSLEQSWPSRLKDVSLNQIVVWVDPLDGTKEYTEGFPENVTVLVGIAVDGVPEAGIIHQPFYQHSGGAQHGFGRTICGVAGLGVFGLSLAARHASRGSRIVATTRSHPSPSIEKTIEAIHPDRIVRIGGAGNKIVHILEGNVDAYIFPSPGTSKWDTCAGEAVLRAAGGSLTNQHGESYSYSVNAPHPNDQGVLASLTEHDFYVQKAKEALSQLRSKS